MIEKDDLETDKPPHVPEEAGAEDHTLSSLPRFIKVGLIAFIVTCLLVFAAGSMIAPNMEPGFPITERAQPQTDGSFRITLDASQREHWVSVNLSRGTMNEEKTNADLLVQRYVFRAPAGAADLGNVPLDKATLATDTPWTFDSQVDGQLQNPAISGWYDYSYMTHLLKSKNHTYAVQLRSGEGFATFNVVSYYCEPEGTSCVTIDYRLNQDSAK